MLGACVLSLEEDKIPRRATNTGRLARFSQDDPLDCNVDTKIVRVITDTGSSPSAMGGTGFQPCRCGEGCLSSVRNPLGDIGLRVDPA